MSRSFDAILDLLPEAFTSDAVEGTLTRQAGFVVREAMQQLPSLQDGALKWIEYLKKGGLKVELDTSGLDIQLQSLKGTARMVTLGILVVGLVVGSALAAGIGGLEDSALEPVTDIAAVIFAFSAIVGGIAILILSLQLYRQYRSSRRAHAAWTGCETAVPPRGGRPLLVLRRESGRGRAARSRDRASTSSTSEPGSARRPSKPPDGSARPGG